MCGITGFTGQKNNDLLLAMTQALAYRGPDAQGFFEDEKISFGHRRLSIIDLAGGVQPMSDSANQVTVVFNGEIYNFSQLKKEYLSDYKFNTASDTEVIIALYLAKGEDFLQYLNGMFAIALWDSRSQKLILARDRVGKKPLYYTEVDGNIYFSSEPKSLTIKPLPKQIDLDSLNYYLQFQYIPFDKSIFRGIKKLLPGHLLIWQNGKKEIKKYWNLNFSSFQKPSLTKLTELIEDSVKIRLVADVPLGVFLSGGIDSTAVAYFAAKNSAQRIKTFSIGFAEKSFDESDYAKQAASFLKTDHHHKQFSKNDLLELIPKIFTKLDEPMADASILPTYLLSEFTRQYVTVALGGDGGDELFAGYPTFQAHALANYYSKVPSNLKLLIETAVDFLPVSHDNLSLDFKLKQFIKGAEEKNWHRDFAWTAAFNKDELENLFVSGVADDVTAEVSSFLEEQEIKSEMNKVLNYWQKTYLVDDILTKADRASMYNSLETRSPLLDYRLVEYVNSLPYSTKVSGLKTKAIFKKAMKGKIPNKIINRKKKGFGVPLSSWFNNELKDFLTDSLSSANISKLGILNNDYVQKLVTEHVKGVKDNRMKLWTLVCLVNWYNNFIE